MNTVARAAVVAACISAGVTMIHQHVAGSAALHGRDFVPEVRAFPSVGRVAQDGTLTGSEERAHQFGRAQRAGVSFAELVEEHGVAVSSSSA